MLATLNLHLSTTSEQARVAADGTTPGADATTDGGHAFSDLLDNRVGQGGERLPDSGNPLPESGPQTRLPDGLDLPQAIDAQSIDLEAQPVALPDLSTETLSDSPSPMASNIVLDLHVAYPGQLINDALSITGNVAPSDGSVSVAASIASLAAGANEAKVALNAVNSAPDERTEQLSITRLLPNTVDLARQTNVNILQAPVANVRDGVSDRLQPRAAAHDRPLVDYWSAAPVNDEVNFDAVVTDRSLSAVLDSQVRADVRSPAIANSQSGTLSHNVPVLGASVQAPAQSMPNVAAAAGSPAGLAELIATPVRDTAWGEKFGERVVMLSGQNIQTAKIQLTPAELGPLRVQIRVEDGTANVMFHSQHALTREAIEQALPRLREMFADSGIALGQTEVSDQQVADERPDRQLGGEQSAAEREFVQDDTTKIEEERRITVRGDSLLDTFV